MLCVEKRGQHDHDQDGHHQAPFTPTKMTQQRLQRARGGRGKPDGVGFGRRRSRRRLVILHDPVKWYLASHWRNSLSFKNCVFLSNISALSGEFSSGTTTFRPV